MVSSRKRFHLVSFLVLLLLSAYPVAMGAKMAALWIRDGEVAAGQYARYVIPYAAIGFSLTVVAALYPWIVRRFRKGRLAASFLSSIALFALVELPLERIPVDAAGLVSISGRAASRIDGYQSLLCSVSPDAFRVRQAMQFADGDATYKIHFYLVSLALLFLGTALLHAFALQAERPERSRRGPLLAQSVAAAAFLGLCLFANATGMYRDGAPVQNPTASVLTAAFFVGMGTAVGTTAAALAAAREARVSAAWPAALAAFTCIGMYVGESILLGGTLYRFGTSWFFAGLPGLVAAPADIAVVASAALLAAGIARALRRSAALPREAPAS